jgi:hypothetical protein
MSRISRVLHLLGADHPRRVLHRGKDLALLRVQSLRKLRHFHRAQALAKRHKVAGAIPITLRIRSSGGRLMIFTASRSLNSFSTCAAGAAPGSLTSSLGSIAPALGALLGALLPVPLPAPAAIASRSGTPMSPPPLLGRPLPAGLVSQSGPLPFHPLSHHPPSHPAPSHPAHCPPSHPALRRPPRPSSPLASPAATGKTPSGRHRSRVPPRPRAQTPAAAPSAAPPAGSGSAPSTPAAAAASPETAPAAHSAPNRQSSTGSVASRTRCPAPSPPPPPRRPAAARRSAGLVRALRGSRPSSEDCPPSALASPRSRQQGLVHHQHAQHAHQRRLHPFNQGTLSPAVRSSPNRSPRRRPLTRPIQSVRSSH